MSLAPAMAAVSSRPNNSLVSPRKEAIFARSVMDGMRESYSSKNAFDNLAVDIGQAKIPALVTINQFVVLKPEAMQNGRVLIVNMDRVGHDVVTVLIGFAVSKAGLDPASGHPDGEAPSVMIAPIVVLFNFA